jgi:hypothetical protein
MTSWDEVGQELVSALQSMLNTYHPCSKPIGAPGSPARADWEHECSVRHEARAAIKKARGLLWQSY